MCPSLIPCYFVGSSFPTCRGQVSCCLYSKIATWCAPMSTRTLTILDSFIQFLRLISRLVEKCLMYLKIIFRIFYLFTLWNIFRNLIYKFFNLILLFYELEIELFCLRFIVLNSWTFWFWAKFWDFTSNNYCNKLAKSQLLLLV